MDYNNRNKPPGGDARGNAIPWAVVIIMMVALLPVGLILLFLKLYLSASHAGNYARNPGWQTQATAYNNAYTARGAGATAREAGAEGRYTASRASYATRGTGESINEAARSVKNAAQEASNAARQATQGAGTVARQAAQEAGTAVRQAAQEVGTAIRQAAQEAGAAAQHAATQYTGYSKPTMPMANRNMPYGFVAPPVKKKKKRKDRTPLDRKTGKFASVFLLLVSIPLFIIGGTMVANAASSFLEYGINEWYKLFIGFFFLIGALVLFLSRKTGVRRYIRYKNYYAFAAGHGVVPIQDMARASGVSTRAATRDIHAMISDGYFGPGAYFDSELNSLVLSPDAAKEARQAAKNTSAAQETPPPSAEAPANPYMAIITELRELNVTIADISISNKIDRIEEITAKIFRIVEEDPEKQPQIRRFMSYYLPTTLKLLRSYATLEKQGVKGENITSAKENIERILDTLATGFEQQLDQLFRADAIDIAADITVLENLMQQDGLSGDKSEFRTMEGSSW